MPAAKLTPAECRAAGRLANAKLAVDAYQPIVADVRKMRSDGFSLTGIADCLNEAGHVTRQGKPFHPNTVRRILARANAEAN